MLAKSRAGLEMCLGAGPSQLLGVRARLDIEAEHRSAASKRPKQLAGDLEPPSGRAAEHQHAAACRTSSGCIYGS